MNRRDFLSRTLLAGFPWAVARGAHAAAVPEEDVFVTASGVAVAGRFTRPQGRARGAVLLIPGSLYSDADGNYPSMNMRPHAYADIARQLGARGFGVLRMAKVGPGTGSRVLDPAAAVAHNAFLTRVDVAAAGLDWIRHRIAARPVIVAGHSEGAVVASLLARSRGNSIDGVVSLSGPALPILEILRAQVAAQPGVSGDMTLFVGLIGAIRAGEAPSAEARSHPHTALLASMPAPALAYLRSADKVDPVDALARVRQPVLIVQGGRDVSVPPHHARMLRAGRGALPTQDAYFPALTHFYKIAPPGLNPRAAMALEGESDPAVAKVIAEWVRRLR